MHFSCHNQSQAHKLYFSFISFLRNHLSVLRIECPSFLMPKHISNRPGPSHCPCNFPQIVLWVPLAVLTELNDMFSLIPSQSLGRLQHRHLFVYSHTLGDRYNTLCSAEATALALRSQGKIGTWIITKAPLASEKKLDIGVMHTCKLCVHSSKQHVPVGVV